MLCPIFPSKLLFYFSTCHSRVCFNSMFMHSSEHNRAYFVMTIAYIYMLYIHIYMYDQKSGLRNLLQNYLTLVFSLTHTKVQI